VRIVRERFIRDLEIRCDIAALRRNQREVAGVPGQLRTVSIVVAIVASVLAAASGAIMFFVVEPPLIASIFLASGVIAIACFVIAGLTGYFAP
jgi:hypothetical protein